MDPNKTTTDPNNIYGATGAVPPATQPKINYNSTSPIAPLGINPSPTNQFQGSTPALRGYGDASNNLINFYNQGAAGAQNLVNSQGNKLGQFQQGQESQLAANYGQQKQDYGQLFSNLQGYYGVGDKQAAADSISQRITQLKSAPGFTGGTAGQLEGAMNANWLPAQQNAQNIAQNAEKLSNDAFSQLSAPLQQHYSQLAEQQAREATQFTQQQSNELSTYLNQFNSGIKLSSEQAAHMADLAIKEQDMWIAKKQTETAYAVAQLNNQYHQVNGGLYDTINKKWIIQPGLLSDGSSTGGTGGTSKIPDLSSFDSSVPPNQPGGLTLSNTSGAYGSLNQNNQGSNLNTGYGGSIKYKP